MTPARVTRAPHHRAFGLCWSGPDPFTLGVKEEVEVVTAQVKPSSVRADGSLLAGTFTLVAGALLVAAVAFTYVLSLSDAVNPPTWVRAIGLAWLPIGLGVVPVGYVVARKGAGRDRARLGVLIGLVGLIAFVALVVAIG